MMEHARKQQVPKETIDSSDTTELEEFDQKTTLFQEMTNSKSFNRSPKQRSLYHALMESILEDEEAMDKGKTNKDIEPSKKAKSTESSKGTSKSQPKSTGKSAQAEETVFEAGDTQGSQNLGDDMGNTDEPPVVNVDPKFWFKKPEIPPTLDPEWNKGKSVENKPTKWLSELAKAEKPSRTFDDLMSTPIYFSAFVINRLQISELTKDILVGPAYNILKGTCKSYVEIDYNMEECYKELTDQLDWNNPEGDRYPFDLSKPLPLVMSGNRQIVSVDYFFNNDLAYLQGGSTGRTYTTSLTKTKAAKYDLPGIKDMVPNLWSPVKVAYDKHALLGTSHWGPKRQRFYGYASNRVSKLGVYSTKRILAVTNVKNRLFNLKGDIIVHLAAALRMFTRRIVIQKRVEDLKLGFESYQKKLNISRPMTHKARITDLKPYSAYYNPQGFIYVDKLGRNRLMCSHELYKFSDGTLISHRDTLKDMANNLEMGYTNVMPRRRWSHLDKKMSCIMIKDIDRQLLDRMLLRSLEKFVGGREYGEDLRLL
ncbi:hypothetical protein Tco_0377640 [Tanacetum coccineum]